MPEEHPDNMPDKGTLLRYQGTQTIWCPWFWLMCSYSNTGGGERCVDTHPHMWLTSRTT